MLHSHSALPMLHPTASPTPAPPPLPSSLLLLPFPFLLFVITWMTFLLFYVMLTCPVARHAVHPSCTPVIPDCPPPPHTPCTSSRDPSGSPMEAPRSTWLCVGLMWHLPH